MVENTFKNINPFPERIIIFAGAYGSGKTEVAVNYAFKLSVDPANQPLSIIDLDIVNPYFRSREAREEMGAQGINVIMPLGEHCHADLPIIVPRIRGTLEEEDGKVILDVGGDDLGARVLSSMSDVFDKRDYQFLLVLNANRPFTSTVEGAEKMIRAIEGSSRLKFTGIVSNTHLIAETSPEIVKQGIELSRKVSEVTDLPLVFASAMQEVAEQMDSEVDGVPLFTMGRRMLKPWEKKNKLTLRDL